MLATTHLGRVVAGLSNVSGIAMIAMLTSSFMLNLHYTPEEESAILMIEKERAVRSAAKHSARFLQLWFRMKRRQKLYGAAHVTVAMRNEFHKLKTAFRKCRDAAFADYSDMCADGAKIDQLGKLLPSVSCYLNACSVVAALGCPLLLILSAISQLFAPST